MDDGQLPLRDIHTPEAIGWWPPAPGWWLIAVLLPLIAYLLYRLVKRLTRNTAVKSAKKIMQNLKADRQLDNRQKLHELSALIRRVAISTSGRQICAGLTGQAWLEFLDTSVKGSLFSQGPGRLLNDAPYRNAMPSDQDIAELTAVCESWLNAQTSRKR